MELVKENLFQIFSQIFIESQQSFSKSDIELRSKCRTLSEKLSKLVDELEANNFEADLTLLSSLEEDTINILKSASELETKRNLIKESVVSLKSSTKNKFLSRGK